MLNNQIFFHTEQLQLYVTLGDMNIMTLSGDNRVANDHSNVKNVIL